MKRALPILAVVLISGGLFLLVMAAWEFQRPPTSSPPFGYTMIADGPTTKFPELKLDEKTGLNIRKYEVRIPDIEKPIADFYVADDKGADPVLLEWRNHLAEPVLTIDSKIAETKALADAIIKHVPADAIILGWWDISRRLQLLTKSEVVFKKNLSQPLLLPTMWRNQKEAITALEHKFWKVNETGSDTKKFDLFLDALLSNVEPGAAKLRKLAPGRDIFVIVHVSDAFRIGVTAPERFGIGYKDIAAAKIHSMVKYIKGWIKQKGHKAYTVLPLSDQVRRTYFLTDEPSTKTLIAQMLPFNTSNPFKLTALQLVSRHGGYWVYKLPQKSQKTVAN